MDPRTLLSAAPLYRGFRRAITRNRRDRLVCDRLRLQRGQRLLDIGCGTGDALSYVPTGVEYVGIDVSIEYIEAARKRFSSRGTFHVLEVGRHVPPELGCFDRALADGVIHHLDEEGARALLALAGSVLQPTGHLVTIDPCLVPDQPRLARRLIESDRGEFVRTEQVYRQLASDCFASVRAELRHDLLRVPYSHLLMECREPIQPCAARAGTG